MQREQATREVTVLLLRVRYTRSSGQSFDPCVTSRNKINWRARTVLVVVFVYIYSMYSCSSIYFFLPCPFFLGKFLVIHFFPLSLSLLIIIFPRLSTSRESLYSPAVHDDATHKKERKKKLLNIKTRTRY